MMRLYLLIVLVITLLCVSQAQDDPVLVGFVVGSDISPADVTESQAQGISQLANLVRSFGVTTTVVDLLSPVPEDVDVLVLVRPRYEISLEALDNLWAHLERGNDLFFAFDPPYDDGVSGDPFSAEMNARMYNDYGIRFTQSFVIRPWYTPELITTREGSFVQQKAGDNTILATMRRYDLPVYMWGATSIAADASDMNSAGYPLVVVEDEAYGETNLRPLRQGGELPLEQDADDLSVPLPLVVAGENAFTGSRVVVVGDSHALMNGNGFLYNPVTNQPLYMGNYLFAQGLFAWLFDLPEPPLLRGVTWVGVDGQFADWSAEVTIVQDNDGDGLTPGNEITQAQAFRNESFMYLAIETAAPPHPDTVIYLELDETSNDDVDNRVFMGSIGVYEQPLTASVASEVPDGSVVISNGIEARLPLRVVGQRVAISRICLLDAANPDLTNPTDCLSGFGGVTVVQQPDPLNMRFPSGGVARVSSSSNISLFSEPSSQSSALTSLAANQLLAMAGRSEDAQWVFVLTASHEGWVSTLLIDPGSDLLALPVREP